jgi:hypothetical protein
MEKINKIITFWLIFLLLIIPFGLSTNAYGTENPYQKLFQTELQLYPFSVTYENKSLPGFDAFNQALNNSSSYPMNSYNLLVGCYRTLMFLNLTQQMGMMGSRNVAKELLSVVQKNLSDITFLRNAILPKTLSSLEWHDLVGREIIDATDYLSKANSYYINEDYNSSIAALLFADTSLHKAKGFISVANERNTNATVIYTSNISITVKQVASQWIDHASSTITFYQNMGYKQYLGYPNSILNQSKDFFSNELFYVAIIQAASSNALAEYYVHRSQIHSESSDILTVCDKYLDFGELSMNSLYNSDDIDAPFTESTIELAKIHLNEAKENENESSATATAGLSIQESLIAIEQAKAVWDLRNVIMHGQVGIDQRGDNENKKNQTDLQFLLLLIICIESILLMILFFKKYR